MSNQSAESDQSPESHEDTEHPDSTGSLKPVENAKFGSKSKCSHDVRCRVTKGSCDDKPSSAATTSVGKK